MKNFILLIIFFVVLACYCFANDEDKQISSSKHIIQVALDENSNEIFFDFLWAFCTDTQFQLSRIKFPLEHTHWDDDYAKLVTDYVNFEEWKFVQFYFRDNKYSALGQVYDSFEHKLRDSNERVYAWHGLGNGVEDYYYFKRINGKWYLIRNEDLST
jgi:hypothetical protein